MSDRHVEIKRGIVDQRILDVLKRFIRRKLGYDPDRLLRGKLAYTCFNSKCFIYQDGLRFDGASLLYSGLWVGVLLDNKPYLSPVIYERIYSEKGIRAAVVIGEKGVKAFLYGNDVLEQSIIKKYPPLDGPLAVIDASDYSVIGVAEPAKQRGVYRNIYDLGMFLREWG